MIGRLLIAVVVMIFILMTLRRGRKRGAQGQKVSRVRELLALAAYGIAVLVMVYVIRILFRL